MSIGNTLKLLTKVKGQQLLGVGKVGVNKQQSFFNKNLAKY